MFKPDKMECLTTNTNGKVGAEVRSSIPNESNRTDILNEPNPYCIQYYILQAVNGPIIPGIVGTEATALTKFIGHSCLDKTRKTTKVNESPITPEKMTTYVLHPVTKETITRHKKLIDKSLSRDVWSQTMCIELECLTQGCGKTTS